MIERVPEDRRSANPVTLTSPDPAVPAVAVNAVPATTIPSRVKSPVVVTTAVAPASSDPESSAEAAAIETAPIPLPPLAVIAASGMRFTAAAAVIMTFRGDCMSVGALTDCAAVNPLPTTPSAVKPAAELI